jgi:hypothetical protein
LGAAGSRLGRLPDWAVASMLVVCYLILQVVFLEAPFRRDPFFYFDAADHPLDLEPEHKTTRIGLLLPVWMAQRVFGYSEAAFYAVPVVVGTLLVIATYYLGKILFGRLVGTIAAVLVFLNPFVLTRSSQVWPDLPATALLTGGLALLIAVAAHIEEGRPWTRRSHAMLIGSGLLFGGAYLSKEVVVFFAPLVLLVWWRYHLPWRKIWWLAGAGLAVLAAEFAWNWVAFGDPFTRIEVLLGRVGASKGDVVRQVSAREFQGTFLKAFTALPRLLLRETAGWLFLVLAAATAVWTYIERSRRFIIIALWLFGLWFVFSAIGWFEKPGGGRVLRLDKDRYWFPILPALFIGGIAAIRETAHRLGRARWRPIVVAVPLAFAAVFVGFTASATVGDDNYFLNRDNGYREVRTWLASEARGYDTVWSDTNSLRLIDMYSRTSFGGVVWEGELASLAPTITNRFLPGRGLSDEWLMPPEQLPPGSLILYDTDGWKFAGAEQQIPDYLVSRPPGWSLLHVTRDGRIAILTNAPIRDEWTAGPLGVTEQPWVVRQFAFDHLEPGDQLDPVTSGPLQFATGADTEPVRLDSPPFARAVEVPPGSYLTARIHLAAMTPLQKSPKITCRFEDERGERRLVEAAANFTTPRSFGPVDFMCVVPDGDGIQRVFVRLGFDAVGNVWVGSGELWVTVPEPRP